jgi:hypothetical protein
MGNCISKKKTNHFENNELINNDEHLIHTMENKIDDIYLKMNELNNRVNEHEINTSTNLENIAKDIQFINSKVISFSSDQDNHQLVDK